MRQGSYNNNYQPVLSSLLQGIPSWRYLTIQCWLISKNVIAKAGPRLRQSSNGRQQRPKLAKGKRSEGLNLRASSVEQPGARKKEPRLSAEFFAACAAPPGALDAPEAASSSSAVQSVHQLKRTLGRLKEELKKLDGMAWIVADDHTQLKRLTATVCTLQGLKVFRDS